MRTQRTFLLLAASGLLAHACASGLDTLLQAGSIDSAKASALLKQAEDLAADTARLSGYSQEVRGDSSFASIPDSVLAKFVHRRDSLRTELGRDLETLQARFDSLKAQAKAQRTAFLATLKPEERLKLEKKVLEIDARNALRRAAIEERIAQIRRKIEARKNAQ